MSTCDRLLTGMANPPARSPRPHPRRDTLHNKHCNPSSDSPPPLPTHVHVPNPPLAPRIMQSDTHSEHQHTVARAPEPSRQMVHTRTQTELTRTHSISLHIIHGLYKTSVASLSFTRSIHRQRHTRHNIVVRGARAPCAVCMHVVLS